MTEVYSKQVKKALETAQRLLLAKEDDIAKYMVQEIVKEEALYGGKLDILEVFYPGDIYDRLSTPAEGAKYIFIAKCAMHIYELLMGKNSASSSVEPWVTRGSSTNAQLLSVFEWLSRSDRAISDRDINYFKKLQSALEGTSRQQVKMSDSKANMAPVDVIKGLVNQKIKIVNGELR